MKKRKIIIYMLVIVGLLMISTTSVSSIRPRNLQNEEWEATIWITETDGRHDYVIIGEKPDATDGVDIWYDVPKCPPPPSPFVRAYIYHEGLQFPYEYLWFEYRNSTENVYKEWILCSMVFVSSPTEVTITWNKADFRSSGYKRVTLCDSVGIFLVNMKAKNTYTYQSDAYSFNTFVIKTDPLHIMALRMVR